MKKLLYLFLLYFSLTNLTNAQEWKTYVNENTEGVMAKEGDYLWITSLNSLIKYNTITNEKTYFNCKNSDYPCLPAKSITVDNNGNKWIVTRDDLTNQELGIMKFDGNTFTTFTTSNSNIPTNLIYNVIADSNGNVWMSSDVGLIKYDGSNWTLFEPTSISSYSSLNSIALDNNNNIWGRVSEGLFKFDGTDWTLFSSSNSDFPDIYINKIRFDSDNNLWCFSLFSDGIFKYDYTSWTNYNESNSGLPYNKITDFEIEDNNIWIISKSPYGRYITRFTGTAWNTFEPTQDSLNHILILENSDPKVWITTDEGIGKFDGARFIVENLSQSGIRNIYINSIAENSRHEIFTSPYDLQKFNGIEWETYLEYDDFMRSNACFVDSQDNLWSLDYSYGYIRKFDGVDWTKYYVRDFDPEFHYPNCLEEDNDHNIWIGSSTSGIVKYNGTDWTVLNTTNSNLPSNKISELSYDPNTNLLWIATEEGLVKYDGTNWTTYNTSNSDINDNYVTNVYVDKNSVVWLSVMNTENQLLGLTKFDGVNWTVYNDFTSSIPSNNVTAITSDASGNIWIGFSDAGISKFDGTDWTNYNVDNSPLYRNSINTIYIDQNNTKWIGVNNVGLTVFNEDRIPNSYTLTVNVDGNGTVSPSSGIYQEGSTVTLTATPDNEWAFSSWSGDVTGSTNPIQITMDSDKIITANFVSLALTYVPDDNFENYLETHDANNNTVPVGDPNSLGNGIANDDYVYTTRIESLWSLDIGDSFDSFNIADLTGIEDFTELRYLDCYNNQLTQIDLSQNVNLTSLRCNDNQLSSLDLSAQNNLTQLICHHNQLTSLELNQNTELTFLDCSYNQITNLDLSNNNKLSTIWCNNNQLTSLITGTSTAMTEINCENNNIPALDVSAHTALDQLKVANNNLSALNVDNNTALRLISCGDNDIEDLDLSSNTNLQSLSCYDNDLVTLDVSANTKLTSLFCSYNEYLAALNIQNGNNTNISNYNFQANYNPNLTCIQVDDVAYSTANWTNIDATATFSTDCFAGVEDVEMTNLIDIYPNPISHYLTIISEQKATYSIIDNLGRIILQGEISQGENTLKNVTKLSKGIYTIIIDINENQYFKKILKD